MNELVNFVQESNRIEGIHRSITDSQTVKELEAHNRFLALDTLTIGDMEAFVSVCQPDAVLRRRIGMNVRVGSHLPPSGGPGIEIELTAILNLAKILRDEKYAYNYHIKYESLHPFTDGNGRSGRVLWLWMMAGEAPLGFLHMFYYQTLHHSD